MPYSEKDFKPVRRGAIYCAPFCGLGCTHKAFQTATRNAAKLAKKLGHGWKPRVWENLGWHYSAISPDGRIKVHPCGSSGYNAFLGSADSPGGRWAESGKTAIGALRAVGNTAPTLVGQRRTEIGRDRLVARWGKARGLGVREISTMTHLEILK